MVEFYIRRVRDRMCVLGKPVTELLIFFLLFPCNAVGADREQFAARTDKFKSFADMSAFIAERRIHNDGVIDRLRLCLHQIVRNEPVFF